MSLDKIIHVARLTSQGRTQLLDLNNMNREGDVLILSWQS